MEVLTILNETVRRYRFWLVDAMSGGQVRKNILDIKTKMHEKSDASSNDLRNLLDRAFNTTGFFGRYKAYSSIMDFPVIKKSPVKEKYDQFMSSIEIEHVDKIPHLSSGKFRKIICNYKVSWKSFEVEEILPR
jgi:phenylacetate-CoA ligase